MRITLHLDDGTTQDYDTFCAFLIRREEGKGLCSVVNVANLEYFLVEDLLLIAAVTGWLKDFADSIREQLLLQGSNN